MTQPTVRTPHVCMHASLSLSCTSAVWKLLFVGCLFILESEELRKPKLLLLQL